MSLRHRALTVALLALVGATPAAAQSLDMEDGNALVQARLGSEFGAVWPGKETTLAVVLDVAPGWHIYWKHPGDAGMPTSVDLTLPEGLVAGDVQWPAPERFVADGIASFGYEGQVTLLVPVRAAADLKPGQGVTVRGRVEWLVCNEGGCLPGGADVELSLHVADGAAAPLPTPDAGLIAAARRAVPGAAPDGLRASWAEDGRTLVLELPGAAALAFYPCRPEQIGPADLATRGAVEGARLELTYPEGFRHEVAGVLAVRRADGATTHHEVVVPAPRS